MGYALNYQGYFGYVDTQFIRIIDKLSLLFDENEKSLKLNRKGHEAILGHHNFASELKNDMFFGGVKKYEFQFSKIENKLIKTV